MPKIDKSTQNILIYGALIGGGYYFVLRPLLVNLGILQSPEQVLQQVEQTQNVQSYIENAIATQQPTKSIGEWQVIANQIYQDLKFASVSDDKNDSVYQLCRVKNDADVALLYKNFGNRQEYYFGIPVEGFKDLQQFVRSNLSDSQINTINSNYSRKGIKYKF
jgi:hypothetical protein